MQLVGGDIIDPAKRESRTKPVAFRGVIVNHIENHFDPGGVKIAHHFLEFHHLLAHLAAAGVISMRSKKTDGVVSPVIR